MLLSLSSVFRDFFDSPEDDPLLQDESDATSGAENTAGSPGPADEQSGSERASYDAEAPVGGDGRSSKQERPDSGTPDEASVADPIAPEDRGGPPVPEGLASNLLGGDGTGSVNTSGSSSQYHEPSDDQHSPKRTKKFVVPYNANPQDLEEVNEAISAGWSFRRIAVTKTRASVKPEGKKVIITLELDEPRSLFDF
jgi:hypothetical protein